MYRFSILSLSMIVIALLLVLLAAKLLRRSKEAGSKPLSFYLIAVAIYSFSCAFEIVSPDMETAIGWARFQYIGLSFMPFIMFWFSLRYFNFILKAEKYYLIITFFISVTFIILQSTHHLHNLFYINPTFSIINGYSILKFERKFFHGAFQYYTIGSLLFLAVLTVVRLRMNNPYYRKQARIVALSAICPVVFYVWYAYGLTPIGLDLIPISFSVTVLVLGFATLRSNFLGPTPIAIRSVFDALSNSCVIIDTGNRVVSFNEAATTGFPYVDHSSIGVKFSNLISEFPELCSIIEEDLSDTPKNVTITCEKGEGLACFTVHVSTIEAGRSLGKSVIFTDITEEYKKTEALRSANTLLEEQRQQLATLNELKDMLIKVISHDLKEPFVAFRQILRIMETPGTLQDESVWNYLIEDLNGLLDGTDLMLRNLFALSLESDGQLSVREEIVSVEALVDTTLDSMQVFARRKGVVLQSEQEQDVTVLCDENMLLVVLRNIVDNAIKFTPSGGSVRIQISITADFVYFIVVDTGMGMSSQSIAAILSGQKGISSKGTDGERGTGLGLSACRFFLGLHNSRMQIEKNDDIGTRVLFPLKRYKRL
jgi:signal transduction histidine kinase